MPRLSLFLGYSIFFVQSEPEYSYKLYSYKKKRVVNKLRSTLLDFLLWAGFSQLAFTCQA